MSLKSLLKEYDQYLDPYQDVACLPLMTKEQAIETDMLLGSPRSLMPFWCLYRRLKLNISSEDYKLTRQWLRESNYLVRLHHYRSKETNSLYMPRRLIGLFLPSCNIYCLNNPTYRMNETKPFIRLPKGILALGVFGTLVTRVPCGFFIYLSMGCSRVYTQQKVRESNLSLLEYGVVTRKEIINGMNRDKHEKLTRKTNFGLSTFIPKSTTHLNIRGYLPDLCFINEGVYGSSIYNNVYSMP